MKLLLDECVTNYLKAELIGHEVSTVDDAGFKGLKNGELLLAASEEFDVLVTVDQNLRFQQNLENYSIGVVLLRAKRTSFTFLKPLIPDVLKILETVRPGQVVIIASGDTE